MPIAAAPVLKSTDGSTPVGGMLGDNRQHGQVLGHCRIWTLSGDAEGVVVYHFVHCLLPFSSWKAGEAGSSRNAGPQTVDT